MTQDEVIKLAKEAGFGNYAYEATGIFERFAAMVAAAEREKCTGTQEFVTLPREVVELAIEAIGDAKHKIEFDAIDALIAALKQPPTTEQSSVVQQPQANQPAMTPIAQRKLEDLVASGYTISGYSIYHEQKHQHGFVTGAGLVGWWKPEGMEYPQPLGEQEPVAEQKSGSDMISVPRSLLGAACSAINRKQDAPKVLEQLRRYTVGDLSKSSVVEQQQEQEWKHRLGNLLAVIHGDGGHYIDAHGWDKAQVDAEEKIARIMTERSQPVEQEPVVWAVMQDGAICWEADYSFSNEPGWCDSDQQSVPLYTHPQPKREPLTDEEIDKLDWGPRPDEPMTFKEGLRDFARSIEAAHNIK